MIPLDVNDPTQVSSPTAIVVDLGIPNRSMLICSGIAMSSWQVHDDGTIYHETMTVNLRQTAVSIDQATATVGLASIGNGDTNFDFAVNATSLSLDPSSGKLILTADLALMGDPSALDRVGYQVVAIVITEPSGISGIISWSKLNFDASGLTSMQIAQLCRISAATSTGGGGFSSPVYTAVAYGTVTSLTSDATNWNLAYNIPGPPFNESLTVQVVIGSLLQSHDLVSIHQDSGPNPITLTASEPGVSDVNFYIAIQDVR